MAVILRIIDFDRKCNLEELNEKMQRWFTEAYRTDDESALNYYRQMFVEQNLFFENWKEIVQKCGDAFYKFKLFTPFSYYNKTFRLEIKLNFLLNKAEYKKHYLGTVPVNGMLGTVTNYIYENYHKFGFLRTLPRKVNWHFYNGFILLFYTDAIIEVSGTFNEKPIKFFVKYYPVENDIIKFVFV